MGILCLFLICIVVMSLYYGYHNVEQIDFIIEVKKFSNPYYRMGLFFEDVERGDRIVQKELSIGLFVVNIVFIFYSLSQDE